MVSMPLPLYRSVLLLLIGLMTSVTVRAECSKTLVVNQATWKPYMYKTDEGRPAGLDYDFVKAIVERAGCDFELVELPSKRALVELRAGGIDMVAGASITPDREVYGRFTVSYRDEAIALFIRQSDRELYPAVSLKDLIDSHQLQLGAVIGAYYGEEYAELDQNSLTDHGRLVLLNNNERLLEMLIRGRIDVAIGDRISLSALAKDLGYRDRVAVHPYILNQGLIHFMLSKASTTQEDLSVINQAIDDFLGSEEHAALLRQYGVRPFYRE